MGGLEPLPRSLYLDVVSVKRTTVSRETPAKPVPRVNLALENRAATYPTDTAVASGLVPYRRRVALGRQRRRLRMTMGSGLAMLPATRVGSVSQC